MKRKKIYPVTALSLAACMCLLRPVVSGAAGGDRLELETECSLTIQASSSQDQKYLDDLAEAGVVLDLYKVADVEKVSGYDTYSYTNMGAYGYEGVNFNKDKESNEDWKQLAQEAAQIALIDQTDVEPVAVGRTPGQAITTLDDGTTALGCGLYLVIARGSDLEEYTEWIDAAAEEPEDSEEASDSSAKTLVTIAKSPYHTYSFEPQLISLPMRDAVVGTDSAYTSDDGEWSYDVTAALKPAQARRYGSLSITKTLRTYETTEPAIFVFQIEAMLEDEKVYSDVASLIFTSAGQQTIEIVDKIPAGATVTVTEIYEGGVYELVTAEDETVEIIADEFVNADFVNDYSEDRKGGHGIINQFDYTGTGEFDGWSWTQVSAAE